MSKVNLPSVGPTGEVNPSRNTALASWNGAVHGIKDVLLALKNEMVANRNTNQPPDGETYNWGDLFSIEKLIEQKQEIHWSRPAQAQIKLLSEGARARQMSSDFETAFLNTFACD